MFFTVFDFKFFCDVIEVPVYGCQNMMVMVGRFINNTKTLSLILTNEPGKCTYIHIAI